MVVTAHKNSRAKNTRSRNFVTPYRIIPHQRECASSYCGVYRNHHHWSPLSLLVSTNSTSELVLDRSVRMIVTSVAFLIVPKGTELFRWSLCRFFWPHTYFSRTTIAEKNLVAPNNKITSRDCIRLCTYRC